MKHIKDIPKAINLIKSRAVTKIESGKLCPMSFRNKGAAIPPKAIYKFEYFDCQFGPLAWVFTFNQN